MMGDCVQEIRWHGRGGQGTVTAARLLAQAAFVSGWEGVTSAPSFGAERRGAPIVASTRLSDQTIRILSQVVEPDTVVVLDDSLIGVANATLGLRAGGLIIVNTVRGASELDLTGDFQVVTADVTGAALAAGVVVGGQPMVSAAVLGSVARATGFVTLESVESAIGDAFKSAPAARNTEAARIAYECTDHGRLEQ